MATDGNLLQGEITDFSRSRLQEREVVESLLSGLLRALVDEQLIDARFEATPSLPITPSPTQEKNLPEGSSTKTMTAVGAEAKSNRERKFVCLPGGREGTA